MQFWHLGLSKAYFFCLQAVLLIGSLLLFPFCFGIGHEETLKEFSRPLSFNRVVHFYMKEQYSESGLKCLWRLLQIDTAYMPLGLIEAR